ncbi:lysophospholipid acyltransferase family protein [Novosphingobium sp. M1R2S20]|uniref:Lysophospholipid acyltransferase family protein n=1 Tax=Novosphingobium rhizovicinum TaxID=3228928 RepID=A0ABV3RAK9_9SPHN
MSRLAEVLRSLLFYVVFYIGTAAYVLAALAMLPFDRSRFARIVIGWSRFHRTCTRLLLGIRVVVEGELPQSHALVAMKHESFFEAIDLPNLLNHPAIIAKAELLRIPLWGSAGRHFGLIGVERDQGAKALRTMLTAARALIAEGRVLAIFPEGTRVPHGRVAPLGSGFAGLYKLLRLPVVPVAIDSGPLYHRNWKRSGTITIRVGEPIPAGLAREEIEARVISAINVLSTPTQSELGSAVHDGTPAREQVVQ